MYSKPDSKNTIDDIRSQIETDYNLLVSKYAIPKALHFKKVKSAVAIGMVTEDYPYKKLQKQFIEHILNAVDDETEINRIIGIFMAIWNYFPHDDMEMSPVEMAEELAPEEEKDYDIYELMDEILLGIKSVVDEKIYRQGKKIGLLKKESKEIIDILANPKINPSESLDHLFLLLRNKKNNKSVTMEDIQPFVRAISFAENHTPAKLDNNHYTSRMLQDLVRGSIRPTSDPKGKVTHFNPEFLLSVIQETIELIQNDGEAICADENHIDTAHHLLSWVVDIDNFYYLTEFTPYVLSPLLLGAAGYITSVVTQDNTAGYSSEDVYFLVENDYKTRVSYEKDMETMTQKILKVCSDPMMCIPDMLHAPDNYIDKLRIIVPKLKKLRDDDDIPDGFIPSPYLGMV